MHLLNPVAQAVHHELHGPGVQHVEHVPGSGEIDVLAGILRVQVIVRLVVDSAEGNSRAEVAALAGMIIDDVEDHLDAHAVQCPDHHLELLHLLAQTAGRVAAIRREIADRVVAPVVDQPTLGQAAFAQDVMDRQQLDGRDAEVQQVIDDRLGGEGEVGATELLWYAGVLQGEAASVALVDQRTVPRRLRWPIVSPGKGRVDDHALWQIAGAVTRVLREILLRVADHITE